MSDDASNGVVDSLGRVFNSKNGKMTYRRLDYTLLMDL